jgi:hypothetical protein
MYIIEKKVSTQVKVTPIFVDIEKPKHTIKSIFEEVK